jgi:hypothetical protein
MNPNELAEIMLLWAKKRAELDELESKIAGAVLAIGQSKTTGDVVASYSKGRNEYDYKTPCEPVFHSNYEKYIDTVKKYTASDPVIDWRSVAKELGVEPVVVKTGTPSVSVKLKNGKDGSK